MKAARKTKQEPIWESPAPSGRLDKPPKETAAFASGRKDSPDRSRKTTVKAHFSSGQARARKLAREAEIIAEIGRIVSSTLTLEEIFERFAAQVRKLIPFDRLAICLVNADGNTSTISYLGGVDIQERPPEGQGPVAQSAMKKILECRTGIIIHPSSPKDLQNEFSILIPNFKDGMRSFLGIPLICADQAIGSLLFQRKNSKAFAQEDLRLSERIAYQVAGAIANARLFQERKRAEEALRLSEKKYQTLVDNSLVGIFRANMEGHFLYANEAMARMFGYETAEEMISDRGPFFCQNLKAGEALLKELQKKGRVSNFEVERLDKTGSGKSFLLSATLEGEVISGMVIDISERKRLQMQLAQAQKMEALGMLAGGIAHDFNNILTAIIGCAELISLNIPSGSMADRNLQELLKAGHRARDLVKQILAFSRRSEQERKPIRLDSTLKEALKLLRASLPSTIEIRQEIDPGGLVQADPTQIHQVLMNLGTNAAQAMAEKGGVVTVRWKPVEISEAMACRQADLEPGSYMRLSVEDTGHGMPPEVLGRIFDPYFTTKEVGKGTGLGLAVVHGIVKGHGGAITVLSEVGKGSTFEVYLPRLDGVEVATERMHPDPLPFGGRERILFVDDEPSLIEVGRQILEHLGYEVETRTSSLEALELFCRDPERFDLLITDMTMPIMTGDGLAQEVLRIRPNIPIILCTGFSERISEEQAQKLGVRELVMKPIVMSDLAQSVRRALDQRREEKP